MNYIFLAIGCSLLMLTLCAFKLRKSVHFLCCFLMIQIGLFTAMLTASLVLIFNKTTVTKWAVNIVNEQVKNGDAKGKDEINKYV